MAQSKITSFFIKVHQPSPLPASDDILSDVKEATPETNAVPNGPIPKEDDPVVAAEAAAMISALNITTLSKKISDKLKNSTQLHEDMEVDESVPAQSPRKTRSRSRQIELVQKKSMQSAPPTDTLLDTPLDNTPPVSQNSLASRSLRRSTRNIKKSLKLIESEETDIDDDEPVIVTPPVATQPQLATTKKRAGKSIERNGNLKENKTKNKKAKREKGKRTARKEKKGRMPKANIPVITIKDSPPQSVASLAPLPSHEFLKLWTRTYQPKSAADLIGHSKEIATVKNWLESWAENFNSKAHDDDVDDDEDIIEDTADGKCLFVHGPSGVGKTALVHAIAADLGYKVLEYNATSQRLTPTLIQKEMSESLQSHTISQVSVASLFRQVGSSNKGSEAKCKPSTMQSKVESNVKLSKSLILFDDLDGILYENNSRSLVELWRSLKHIIISARKPIVFTSSLAPTFLCSELHLFCTVFLGPIDYSPLSAYLSRIFTEESSQKSLREFTFHSRIEFTGDVRKVLNQAQFWHYGALGDYADGDGYDSDSTLIDTTTEVEDDEDDVDGLLGGSYSQHASLLDLISVEDLCHTALERDWKLSNEFYRPYNRHNYDHRISFDLDAPQSCHLRRYQSLYAEALSRLQSKEGGTPNKSIRQLVRSTYVQQESQQSGRFADYLAFFTELSRSQPQLMEQLQSGAFSTGTVTRSKRSCKTAASHFI